MANDVYAYFDAQGTLKERISSPVRANASGNKVYAYLEGDTDGSSYASVTCAVRFLGTTEWVLLSTTATSGYIPANALDPRFFGKTQKYRFNYATLPSSVLGQAGTWEVNFRYTASDGTVYPSGFMTLQIESTGKPAVGAQITIDQYNELLVKIGQLSAVDFSEDEDTGVITLTKEG